MPEGPEVETIRRGLARAALGRVVAGARADSSRVFRGALAPEMEAALTGVRIDALSRHGKFLIADFSRDGSWGGEVLILHMGMSGQLRSSVLAGSSGANEKHAHLVLSFEDGSDIAFIDPRMFGRAQIDQRSSITALPASLAHLGPDAVDSEHPLSRLAQRASRSSVAIKTMLLDQGLVAGIGNMYADEMLFRARLHPKRAGASLTGAELEALEESCREVLTEAVLLGGSSLEDRSYRDLSGELGSFQTKHRVYAREGEPCFECGEPIVREVFAGRSSHFCALCQY